MVGLFYKAVPVLADEDKIGGSAGPSDYSVGSPPSQRLAWIPRHKSDRWAPLSAIIWRSRRFSAIIRTTGLALRPYTWQRRCRCSTPAIPEAAAELPLVAAPPPIPTLPPPRRSRSHAFHGRKPPSSGHWHRGRRRPDRASNPRAQRRTQGQQRQDEVYRSS